MSDNTTDSSSEDELTRREREMSELFRKRKRRFAFLVSAMSMVVANSCFAIMSMFIRLIIGDGEYLSLSNLPYFLAVSITTLVIFASTDFVLTRRLDQVLAAQQQLLELQYSKE